MLYNLMEEYIKITKDSINKYMRLILFNKFYKQIYLKYL